jgi:hypothetical protein
MIELNLLEKKKAIKIPIILGIDIRKINYMAVIISIVFYNGTPPFLLSYYTDLIHAEEAVAASLQSKNSKLEKDIKSRGSGRKELESYTTQIQNAKIRSMQIDEILKARSNPKKIFEVIARTIPEDVSFESLSIDIDDNIVITGESFSSRAIGDFISAINDTPYFGGSITPTKQENKQVTINGALSSVDSFELKGKIKNYDMRLK